QQNDDDLGRVEVLQHAEVQHDHGADEHFKQEQEFALLHEIRLAGLVDQLRHLAHGPVYGEALELAVDHETEQHAQRTEHEADHEQLVSRDAEERDTREVGYAEV